MSVRAYRINKIEQKQDCTFNMWHNTKLIDFFVDNEMWDGRNMDGVGNIELHIKTLKKAIKSAKKLELDDYIIKELKDDIVWLEKKDEEYIQYECY